MFQNTEVFECRHDATSGKFHTMELCFMHKIIKDIVYSYLQVMCMGGVHAIKINFVSVCVPSPTYLIMHMQILPNLTKSKI